MHRCGSGFLLTLAIAFVVALTGCLGKSSSNSGIGGVTSVTLSPASDFSIDIGTTQVFSATARNANGVVVLATDIQFIVSVPPGTTTGPTISIASNGNACAGTWDATDSICNPGTPGPSTVTAVINGVSSPTTTVYVHQHVDSIQITQAQSQPPQYDCFSQGQTWLFQGTAFSNNVDITNTVGPLNWTFSNNGVVTLLPLVPSGQPNVLNQVQATAKSPGITQISATVSGTTSNPFPFTTCLIKAIYLQIGGQGQAGNSITVNNGGAVSIKATAIDTLYGVANNRALPAPPLTWSTTNPEVAAFGTLTNTTGTNSATARNNLGGTTVFASCTPPSCNIGVLPGLPIYSSNCLPPDCQLPDGTQGFGAISVDVTTTAKPTPYTVWATTTDCQDAPGCSSAMFSVTPGTTPIGPILSLPRTPNSMMFNHVSAGRVYLGSDQGLMYVDVGSSSPSAVLVSNSSTPCNVSLCGKVLAISNDGKQVVVSDTVSTPSQVYIFNASSASTPDLVIPGETATAAAFSPDQLKVFILTNTGKMYVYSTADALTSVPIATSVTDVQFSADGSFAYVAGTPASSVSAFSTCSLPAVASVEIGSVGTSSTPMQIFPSPVVQATSQGIAQSIIALEPPSVAVPSTHIEFLTAQFTQDPILYSHPLQLTCNPPTLQSFSKGSSPSLGQGDFTPIYAQLVANGTQVVVVGKKIPAVLLFNVSDGTTTSVPLVNNADPLSASASTDGTQVYVAACDQYDQDGVTCAVGSVHIINTISQGDFQQVQYINAAQNNNRNMCNNGGNPVPQCLPNMLAIKPQ